MQAGRGLAKCLLASLLRSAPPPPPAAAAAVLSGARCRFSTIPEPDDAHLYSEQLHSPHFVQPISISQLDTLCRQPSLKLLVNSATFLKDQLPARLENHLSRLQALPATSNAALAELLASTITSKRQGLQVASDWRLVDTSDEAGLRHFESHLATFREHLEVEVGRLTAAAQHLTEQRGWWANQQQVRWLNRMLDLCHWYLLSARVMLTQHSAALHALEAGAGSGSSTTTSSTSSSGGGGSGSGSGQDAAGSAPGDVLHYHEPGHEATDPDQPYTPPHQALTQERPISLIRRHAPLRGLVELVTEDCRAFCVEKNSAAPDVQVSGGEGLSATLVVPYVEYVLTEVLKNALQAVINRYGAWEVDSAQPVQVELRELAGTASPGSSATAGGGSGGQQQQQQAAAAGPASRGSSVQVVVTDMGNGIPPNKMADMFNYFYSSSQPASSLYGYSRNHGVPFQGIGVGVPMARVYAAFMGGSVEWETDAWRRHTTVTLTLPKHGFTF